MQQFHFTSHKKLEDAVHHSNWISQHPTLIRVQPVFMFVPRQPIKLQAMTVRNPTTDFFLKMHSSLATNIIPTKKKNH